MSTNLKEVIGQKEAIEIVLEDIKEEIRTCAVMAGTRSVESCEATCKHKNTCDRIREIAGMTGEQYLGLMWKGQRGRKR